MGDIEELPKFCPRTQQPCAGKCHPQEELLKNCKSIGKQSVEEGSWFMPTSIDDLLNILGSIPQVLKLNLYCQDKYFLTDKKIIF